VRGEAGRGEDELAGDKAGQEGDSAERERRALGRGLRGLHPIIGVKIEKQLPLQLPAEDKAEPRYRDEKHLDEWTQHCIQEDLSCEPQSKHRLLHLATLQVNRQSRVHEHAHLQQIQIFLRASTTPQKRAKL